MAAPSGEIDLDALGALFAAKLASGTYVAPSAISPRLARHMLASGLASADDLRRVGVTA